MALTIPSFRSSAVLVWMPEGESPTAAAFDQNNVQAPPHPNPEAWWLLGEAIERAMEVLRERANHGKKPWIKVGEELFDPDGIGSLFKTMQKLKGASQDA